MYLDLDGVVADLALGIKQITGASVTIMEDFEVDQVGAENPDLFENLPLIEGAMDAINKLEKHFDLFFLSTAMWSVPASWSGKRIWVEKVFGDRFKKKLILSHRKDLLMGAYLVDDRPHKNGAGEFTGIVIPFFNWVQAIRDIEKSSNLKIK